MLAEAIDQRLKMGGVGVGLTVLDLSSKHKACKFYERVAGVRS